MAETLNPGNNKRSHITARSPCCTAGPMCCKASAFQEGSSTQEATTDLRSVRMRRESCLADCCLYLKSPAPHA